MNFYEEMEQQRTKELIKIEKGICPDCDDPLVPSNGCVTCPNCGWGTCQA